MISLILSFISNLFWASGKVFEWLYARQLADAGKTKEQLERLGREVQQAQIAVAAREVVRSASLRNPGGVPEGDPFLRD